jgi:transposase
MKQKPAERPASSERIIRDIKGKTRKQYSEEEKIRIVLDGLRGEDSIAELCRREGIAQSLYYKWSKEFMEAGKKLLGNNYNKLHKIPGSGDRIRLSEKYGKALAMARA